MAHPPLYVKGEGTRQIGREDITCYTVVIIVTAQEGVMKTLGKEELTERIDEILRLVKEKGETFEVTEHGEVVAHIGPASESRQTVEESDAAAWADLKRIASELGPYWPENTDAVEIVRDVRRDL